MAVGVMGAFDGRWASGPRRTTGRRRSGSATDRESVRGPRWAFFAGEALDHAQSTLNVGAQRRAHFSNDGPLVRRVGYRNLFTGMEASAGFLLFTVK